MLTDSHCHLDRLEASLDSVLQRAKEAGVSSLLSIAVSPSNHRELLKLLEGKTGISTAFGLHPNFLEEEEIPSVAQLCQAAQLPKVVALGESGLDYSRGMDQKERQKENFHNHIAAARKTGLPLVIHSRDCQEDMLALLHAEYSQNGPFPGVMHSFSGSLDAAKQALEMGLYLSFSGVLTFKNAQNVRDVAKVAPLDRILVETDSPYLAPEPKRGSSNEPANVVFVAGKLAEIRELPKEEVYARTTENFFSLFSRAKRL